VSVKITFECSGCHAKSDGTSAIRGHFVSITGRDYGFGSMQQDRSIQSVAPEGWLAWDPYTGCTYCPSCWQSIVDGTCDKEAEVKP